MLGQKSFVRLALGYYNVKLCLHYGENCFKLGFFKCKKYFSVLKCTSLERLLRQCKWALSGVYTMA